MTRMHVCHRALFLGVVMGVWVGVGTTEGRAAVSSSAAPAPGASPLTPQQICNRTCTALCAVHDTDAGGNYTCLPTQACLTCLAGQPANPPMCAPPIDPNDPWYDVCFPQGGGEPPGPPAERALLVTNTLGSIAAFIDDMENTYNGLMTFDGTHYWGALVGMHSAEGGTLSGELQEFVLRTAAYRSKCHNQFRVKLDVNIQAGVKLQVLMDGAVTHSVTGPYQVTDAVVLWTGPSNAVLKVIYDTTALNPGGPPTFDVGFNFKQFRVSSSSGACSPVRQLNDRTVRTALAGAGVSSQQIAAINAIPGAALFPVEADGPMQHLAPSQPRTAVVVPPSIADPWMSDHTTSLRNLIDCDPSGATCTDPTHGGSAKAFSRHGGGHPGITIVQIDTNLNSEAMVATGDYKLPKRWFHDAGVSNENPAGGGSCAPYGTCVPHPAPAHDDHGTGVSSWFGMLHNGVGFMSLTPNSTWWFAGTGLDFNELSLSTYEVAVSDVIQRLGEMNPASIDVISLSFGTAVPNIAMAKAIGDYTDVGVLFVAAAGNEAHDFPIFPASASNVIGVGSTGTYDLIPTGQKTFSDVDELSTFHYPFPGVWGSNKGGDVVMPGTGPKPLIVRYKCAITGEYCVSNEDCPLPPPPPFGNTCTDQENLYLESVGEGTSHATPQVAALLANTLADVKFVHPSDYPTIQAALQSLPVAERKPYLANVVTAALYQSAERWFGSVELPHEEFGYGRGDHMAIMQFLLDSGQSNSTPGEYAVTSTDIGRSLFTKDSGQTTWQDIEPDRMQMVGAGDAKPTRTDFKADLGTTVGSCWNMFNPIYLAGAALGEPLKAEVEDPSVTHETQHYNHQKFDLPNRNVLVDFAFQQRVEVTIVTHRYGVLECLLPFLFPPKNKTFTSVVEQVNLNPSNRTNYTMEYKLDGLGYRYDASDLVVLNKPQLTDYEITPQCCSVLHVMSDMIEEELEEFDQFLRSSVLPSVEIEAMDMVEDALDAHLAFNRTEPQRYWTTRFANSHPSWHPPQFQHWLPGGPPLGAEHKNLDLAPLNHLSSVSKVPILRPVLQPGQDPHLYAPYLQEISILDPAMEPVSQTARWDDVSYQSVNTIREQWNQGDLNNVHKPGGFNEFFATPNDKISDIKIRLTNLEQRNVRPAVQFYPAPTAAGHYGQITSSHQATLWTCANDPVDLPPELVQPAPAFDCVLENKGPFWFDMIFYLHRNDWYAAYPQSEKAQAGHFHHFENRLTVDPAATIVTVTMNPPGLSWWGAANDPCDDISDPYNIGRNCDLRREEAEASILAIYGPAMTRFVDSMSFDRFGVNAYLGPDRFTLRQQLDFLQSYLGYLYGFQFDGFDYDVGTMDGALSTPDYQLIEQISRSSVMVHKIQLDRAPAGEREGGDPDNDLTQPNPPGVGAALTSQSIAVRYGRCIADHTIACDDDSQCGGGLGSCVSLRFCSLFGQPPASYPLDTCTQATVATDCGPPGQWQCLRVPTRLRYADHASVSVGNTAAQSSASLNEVYFTPYRNGATSVEVDSDLWWAIANAPNSIFAVDLEPGSSLKKPAPQPPDHNYVVDGFSRWQKSLVRSDKCSWRANMQFTYDRWTDCPAGSGPACSKQFNTRHTNYSLTPTRQNWDTNPLDPSCPMLGGPIHPHEFEIID